MEKTMRQRMLDGELYIAEDPELSEMSSRARRLLYSFNMLAPDEEEQRHALIAELFGAIGPDGEVQQPFYCDYGSHIFAGEKLFVNYDCVFLDCNTITIGDHVLMAPKVQLYTATHPLDSQVRAQGWEMAYPITIGDDVWIGGGAIICPGVTVGSGSTIGAGSVVTRDIPAGVFAAGNPCHVIRELNDSKRPAAG